MRGRTTVARLAVSTDSEMLYACGGGGAMQATVAATFSQSVSAPS
jgi:hypothetical protein